MVRRFVALVFMLGACARDNERWPSLAPRTAEARGLEAMRQGEVVPAALTPPALPVVSGAIGSRLATVEHGYASARQRLAVERAAMASAITATQGASKDSDAWAAAELQLTRLGSLAARLEDLTLGIDSIERDAAAADPASLGRARALAARLAGDRTSLSRLTQVARDALAR